MQERYYQYDKAGRVNYVVVIDTPAVVNSLGPWYTGYEIGYNTQGLIWMVWELKWRAIQSGTNTGHVDTSSIQYISAAEYRYDSARGRYRVQARDPRYLLPNANEAPTPNPKWLYPYNPASQTWPPAAGRWSDYDGGADIHDDYSLDMIIHPDESVAISPIEQTAHEAGLAQCLRDANGSLSSANTDYLHGNLVGTTERMTDANGMSNGGQVAHRAVFTAFGEPVYEDGWADTRFGYAGSYGYQEAASGDPLADLGWLHVGARYYDPASGRFMQRDPIGIMGGTNVYEYVGSRPMDEQDPTGLQRNGEEAIERILRKEKGIYPYGPEGAPTGGGSCLSLPQSPASPLAALREIRNAFGGIGEGILARTGFVLGRLWSILSLAFISGDDLPVQIRPEDIVMPPPEDFVGPPYP